MILFLLGWLALFVLMLATAYAAGWPGLLGKRADGGFAWHGWPVAAHPGPMVVHCAQGHGRSAMVMAALLVRRSLAATPEEAVRRVKQARPGARLNRWQWTKLRDCSVDRDRP